MRDDKEKDFGSAFDDKSYEMYHECFVLILLVALSIICLFFVIRFALLLLGITILIVRYFTKYTRCSSETEFDIRQFDLFVRILIIRNHF